MDILTSLSIVSSIVTYNYSLTKFLTGMMDLVIPTKFCAKESFSFRMKIEDVNFNEFMLSYGFCNLFTSITLKKTIGIAVTLIFYKNLDLKKNLNNYLKVLEHTFF